MTTTGENKLQSTRQKLKDILNDPENPLSGIFDKIEKTTRIPREYIAVGKERAKKRRDGDIYIYNYIYIYILCM